MSKNKEAKPAKPAAVKYGRGNRKPVSLRLMSITSTIHRKRRNVTRSTQPLKCNNHALKPDHIVSKTKLREIVQTQSQIFGRRLTRSEALDYHFGHSSALRGYVGRPGL